jgi:hypothetical protein
MGEVERPNKKSAKFDRPCTGAKLKCFGLYSFMIKYLLRVSEVGRETREVKNKL